MDTATSTARRPRLGPLWLQVLVAIALGVVVGLVAPSVGVALKPLGDAFIKLIRLTLAPIVFGTVVVGIARMGDLREVGRVGLKALVYFEVVSTIALLLGVVAVQWWKPGAGMHVDPHTLDAAAVESYSASARHLDAVSFLMDIIPTSIADAFVRGSILQIVFFAVLFGVALASIGERGQALVNVLEVLSHVIFRIVALVMKVAPIGAFGAMAYTVGTFGARSLLPLGRLMLDVYVTMALFIFGVLNLILRAYGFSLWHYLKHIREEIVLVLGTSSSEAALPRMLEKMERYGCAKSVVGLVIPAGYSFNLDGTSIYLSMAALFVAQAFNVHLSIAQQLSVLGVLMLTSKGAAGVTGSGFIVLASTLGAMRVVPVEGVAILLGVDRFMSEARAITNLIGNGAATLVIARSENAFFPPTTTAPHVQPPDAERRELHEAFRDSAR